MKKTFKAIGIVATMGIMLVSAYIPDSRKRDDEFSPHLAELPEFY